MGWAVDFAGLDLHFEATASATVQIAATPPTTEPPPAPVAPASPAAASFTG